MLVYQRVCRFNFKERVDIMMIHVDLIWNHLNLGALTRKSVALSVIIAAAKVSSSYQWLGTSMDRFEIFKIFKHHRIEDHRRP